MSDDPEISLRQTSDEKLAGEWALVLLAQGLSPRVRRRPDGAVLSVPQDQVERARAVLSVYESENPKKPAESLEPTQTAGSLVGSTVAGILILLFFIITDISNSTMAWFERGSADAQQILNGEFWRTVTALTLHADVVHALSNAIAVALFLGVVSSVLGIGLGAALMLMAGAGGNLANAFLHGSAHVSVGASTSIFGAVGLLGGVAVITRGRASSKRRVWLPIAAAFALLAMLGTGGERVDIWAHLFGLLVGGVLGILVALTTPRPPGLAIQWACGGAAAAVLIYCWIIALQ
ncbi:MAG: rhomboid family intramembrane serine protease [Betaproteobacteria bacterium]